MNSLLRRDIKELPIIDHNSFVESMLIQFVSNKLDSELFIFKLEKLSSSLFEIYLTYAYVIIDFRNLKKKIDTDKFKEEVIINDYAFLIKSSCHI
jgi:hypothetical protein